jgi:biotin-dependent carboxylase-like uncharacterized protein
MESHDGAGAQPSGGMNVNYGANVVCGVIDVRRAGPLTTVQDLGRPGWAHLGVPRSGALDPPALMAANRLLGNADGAAGLEVTLTGCVLGFARAATIAITGAPARITVNGVEVRYGTAVPVPRGGLLRIGPARHGVRTYLGVAGGIDVPAVLGSRSTDTLSGLGPAPLRDGDRLAVGVPAGDVSTVEFARPAGGDVALRIRPGPRADWFTEAAWKALCGTPYTLTPVSNRIGARLAGASVSRTRPGELASEGVVLGAVQVPAGGQPLVFLADHPTTGGYPVIGVVEVADLPLIAQARPGTTVSFHELVGDGSERGHG